MAKMLSNSLNIFGPFQGFSVEHSLFRAVPHFLIGLFGILMPSLSSFNILEISPRSDVGLVKIFSHSVGCCFVHLLSISVSTLLVL